MLTVPESPVIGETMRSLLRSSLFVLAYVLAPIASAAILADSTADFSDTQGARGWFYGYFPNGNVNGFTKLPVYDSQTQSWQQGTCCVPATRVGAYSFMHPNGTNNGQEQWAAREWVSNYSGSVIVAGRLSKVQRSGKSTGVYGRIFLNHQQVANSYINGGDEDGIVYSAKFTVAQGDILDFVVAPNGADTDDLTYLSAIISSTPDTVEVDFSSHMQVQSASGFLFGIAVQPSGPGPNPPDSLITPLQPVHWRTYPTRSWYDRIQLLAPRIPIDFVVMDSYGIAQTNYSGHGPPWLNWPAYETIVQNAVAGLNPASADMFFEPWNEADDGWTYAPGPPPYHVFFDGTEQQFLDTYLHTFQALRRALGPNAQIEGPAYSFYNTVFMQDFLEYCLANGCEVNALSWHTLNDQSPDRAFVTARDARMRFLNNPRYAPLKIRRIDINEIVGSKYIRQPAGTLAHYQQFEFGGAESGNRSCWSDSAGVNECGNGTLSSLLTSSSQPRGVWFAHQAYADGVATRVRSAVSDPRLVALSSSSRASTGNAQVLLGFLDYIATIQKQAETKSFHLTLKHLDTLATTRNSPILNLHLERIPDTGEAPLTTGPVVVRDIAVGVTAGTADVDLPPLSLGDIYRITVTNPAEAQPAIAAGGVVDPWNYVAGASPGGWATIVGTGIGPATPVSWDPQPGEPLPTSLGGVTVTIGGVPAVLSYASASQVNVLVPANVPPGPNFVVITANGRTSDSFFLNITATHPAVYALPDRANPGKFAVTAALAGTATLIGKPGVDPRVTRGAKPGEQVDLYMVGLGATQVPSQFITDRLFAEAAPILGKVTIQLGNQAINPTFAGLVSPGLYLVRFTVPPNAPAGDQPLQLSIGGQNTANSVYLTIAAN